MLPRWVLACDAGAMFALLVGVAVSIGGGFRASVGDLSLSVTTPVRPFVAAGLLLLVRHAFVRHPDVLTRTRIGIRTLTGSPAWHAALGPFLATRIGLIVVGVLAVYTIGYPTNVPPLRASTSEVLNLPMRWDAGWYRQVARSGYRWNRLEPDAQQNIAFFPAYPMMMRAVARLFGGREPAFTLGGAALSHLLFLWALLLLYQLARLELDDAGTARGTVLLLACYPFSVFHGGVYTESLFLLGAVATWLEFRRERWGRAALWGLLVGLTRPNGFLLAVTLLTLAYTQKAWRSRAPGRRAPVMALAAIAAPVAGAAIFSLYIGALTGNPLQWAEQHAAWGRTFTVTVPFSKLAGFTAEHGIEQYLFAHPYDFMNLVPALCALVLILPVGWRLGPAPAVFVASNVIPPLLAGGVMSMGRITAVLFPLFIWLASVAGRTTVPVALGFALLQALVAVLFYTWRPLV